MLLELVRTDGVLGESGAITRELRLGRGEDCEFRFRPEQDRSVSRLHATVIDDGDALLFTDLGSANGTWVNGEKIQGEVLLYEGDRIQLGRKGPELTVVAAHDTPESPVEKTEVIAPGPRLPRSASATLGEESWDDELADDRPDPTEPIQVRPRRRGPDRLTPGDRGHAATEEPSRRQRPSRDRDDDSIVGWVRNRLGVEERRGDSRTTVLKRALREARATTNDAEERATRAHRHRVWAAWSVVAVALLAGAIIFGVSRRQPDLDELLSLLNERCMQEDGSIHPRCLSQMSQFAEETARLREESRRELADADAVMRSVSLRQPSFSVALNHVLESLGEPRGTILPPSFIRSVRDQLTEMRTGRNTQVAFCRRQACFPFFEPYFDDAELPLTFAYASWRESCFNPCAYSSADAAGMWQFIVPTWEVRTGKKIARPKSLDPRKDPRLDPRRATKAAAGELKSLRDRFKKKGATGASLFAFAGYNANANIILRQTTRLGSKYADEGGAPIDFGLLWLASTDFDCIKKARDGRKGLACETRTYVSAILARAIAGEFPLLAGIDPQECAAGQECFAGERAGDPAPMCREHAGWRTICEPF